MNTTPEEPFLVPAQSELIALAAVMRPTWDPAELERAITGARQAGWPWEKAFAAVVRLLQIRDAIPYHLTVEVRDPRKREAAPSSGPSAEYLAMKAQLAERALANGGEAK